MKFSVVTPDFEGAVPRDRLARMIESLNAQSTGGFELLLIHDGPAQQSYKALFQSLDLRFQWRGCQTDRRFNDFGHSLRDIGMRHAKGEYILHLNADNVLYPNAIETLAKAAERPGPAVLADGKIVSHAELFVFPIVMRGMALMGERLVRFPKHEKEMSIVLSGAPARRHMIDCMQLVMRRETWLREGGWYDKRPDGDSHMYPAFIAKYGARYIPEILGEHW